MTDKYRSKYAPVLLEVFSVSFNAWRMQSGKEHPSHVLKTMFQQQEHLIGHI